MRSKPAHCAKRPGPHQTPGKAEGGVMTARPVTKIGALRDLLVALLHEHERDGALPTSARFLFYELVQRGQLSKERTGARRPNQNLHDAPTDIREDGRVPWY